MLRPKKAHLLPIFIVSILFPLCLVAAQHISRRSRPTHQDQSKNAAPILRDVALTSSGPAKAQDSIRLQVEASYGKMPLSFEPNRGQADSRVKFLSRAGNRTLWLTADEAVLAVGRRSRPGRFNQKRPAATTADLSQIAEAAPAVLRMRFAGGNRMPVIEGEDKQPGIVSYFAGKPEQWRTKIPTYARVRYRNLYPGIDLVFYGNHRQLEYDLVVSPGADPAQIKLGITGAEKSEA